MRTKIAILSVLMSAAALAAQAQPPAGGARTLADMEPVLAQLATYHFGDSRVQQAQFIQFVQDSLGSPELLKQIEARLLKFLQSDATAAGKDFAFRELGLIATNASIPVLTPMLTRADTAEMARYALARIPGPAVDEALRNSLDKATGNIKIGIVNSLGQRRDAKSVPVLAALISPSNPEITEAAAAALAGIADRPALDALAAARSKVSGPLRERLSVAYVEGADRFAARGDKAAAVSVYRQLIAPQESQTVRIRALAGLAAMDGKSAVPALTAEVESKDLRMQTAAIRLLGGIPGADITKVMVTEFPKLPAAGQVLLLGALANRGDVSARPLVMTALKSVAPEVRAAALAALGKLGDSSSVKLLAEQAAAGQGAEQTAARKSLSGLSGSGVDAAIIAAIGSTSGKVKAELIAAAGERGATNAADTLAKAAQETDPDVHREAVRALKNVAGPAQIPALLDLLLKASTAPDRRDATQTLASVLRRSQPAPVGAVLAAYKTASAVEPRLSLIEVLGQTSSEEALPLLRDGLKDSNPEVVRAAILALSGWDSPAPLADLLPIAKSGSSPALQILALRGYLKLLALPSQRPDTDSARLLGEAMRLASQPAEKITVLSLLQAFPCKESLQLAEASVGDEAVATEAKAAVDRINRALKYK
jgi:HEAT repeat protein